jgi:hypothetical protein
MSGIESVVAERKVKFRTIFLEQLPYRPYIFKHLTRDFKFFKRKLIFYFVSLQLKKTAHYGEGIETNPPMGGF